MAGYYYLTLDNKQTGPVSKTQLMDALQHNETDSSCLCWIEGMKDWMPISTRSELVQQMPVPVNKLMSKSPILSSPKPSVFNKVSADPTLDLQAAIRASAARRASSRNNESNSSPQNQSPMRLSRQCDESQTDSIKNLNEVSGNSTPLQTNRLSILNSSSSSSSNTQMSSLRTSNTSLHSNSPFLSNRNSTPISIGRSVSNSPSVTSNVQLLQPRSSNASHWRELHTADGQAYYHNTVTNKTQWDKPEELKNESDRELTGEWYWVPTEEGFTPAHISSRDGRLTTFLTEKLQQLQFSNKDVAFFEPMLRSQLRETHNDLVMLDVMNQPLVLFNLKQRFLRNEIYTNIGTILVSINPYKQLPLYTPSVINDYINRGNRKLPPHVYLIADNAYKALCETGVSQSIVISGESGAGKTQATKYCLQYLVEISGSASGDSVEQRILSANPILEAFGNAKTVRNNNSSRFGKYCEIFFNQRNVICGSQNTTYLLEKSRVVIQSAGERNFHIFYQLVLGIDLFDQNFRKSLELNSIESFYYLNQSGCTTVDDVDDRSEFQEVLRAMRELEFERRDMEQIFTLIAAVLHLGNLLFEDTGDRSCRVSNHSTLSHAAMLMQVSPDALEAVVTSRQMVVQGHDPIVVGLSSQQAVAARDALAKFIYSGLFDWLIDRINFSIGRGTEAKDRSIGILDVFGFEIMQSNSLEQLLINTTNERLQQLFNQHTFKLEEAMYQAEQIQYTHIDYIDNQPLLDLIESVKIPLGLFPSIDEELRMPKTTDRTWVDKILNLHKGNPYLSPDRSSPENFVVRHYAGDVKYDCNGFLEKNKDQLNSDAYELLQQSTWTFLAAMFPPLTVATSTQKKMTLGAKFLSQLRDLMATLNSTSPHFIRTIKSNVHKAPHEFDGRLVLEQLQYSGVFEAIKIRKSGYPFRLLHKEFFERYKPVLPRDHHWSNVIVDNCRTLIQALGMGTGIVQIGTSRVLYRADQHRDMELQRNLALEEVAVLIQKVLHARVAWTLYAECISMRPLLQAALQSNDLNVIENALQKSQPMRFKILEHYQLDRARFVYHEQKRLDTVLSVLTRQDVYEYFDQYVENVKLADDINMRTPLAESARNILKQAQAVRLDIDNAASAELKRLDENEMKTIMERADAIRYTNSEPVNSLRELLYNTGKDEFAKLQLRAAVALKDRARELRCTIKLKDIMFEQMGQVLSFSSFQGLYAPSQWADLKLLSFNREELAMSMLSWTKTPIHAPLTQIPSDTDLGRQHRKTARLLFRNILGYMGDGKYGDGLTLASELLAMCFVTSDIRTEIYCQIIKQLTNNPDASSNRRGWDLLCLCLSTFAPSSDFENYLEQFLRSHSTSQRKYVNVFHETLYGKRRSEPPTPADFAALLAQADAMAHRPFCPAADLPPDNTTVRTVRPDAHHRQIQIKNNTPEVISHEQPPSSTAIPAAALPAPTELDVSWHYINISNAQVGPVPLSQLKADWQSNCVNTECIVWCEKLENWTQISELNALLSYLKL